MPQQQRLQVLDQTRAKFILVQRGSVERTVAGHDDERRLPAVDGSEVSVDPAPLLAARSEVGLGRNDDDVDGAVVEAETERRLSALLRASPLNLNRKPRSFSHL